MYTQYRKPESFGNAYTQQVISMMDNYLRTAIDSTDFDQGRQ
jgi:hypothetical protein